MNCRFCKHPETHPFVDLVNSPASNSFLTKEELNQAEVFYPLNVLVCPKCFLVQVDEYKKATEIFDKEYVYFSSYSTSWLAHSKAYCQLMQQRFGFNSDSLVIEIASNDGYLLQYFKELNIPVLGVEPTHSTAKVAREKGIESIESFFGIALAKELASSGRKADLLLGNNVLAHVPDLNDFVGGMKVVLKEQGVITMEFPHLYQMVLNNQFDTIYHEHFSYLSFHTVKAIFEAQGLELFDVDEIGTHGGSLRIYAKHQEDSSKSIGPNVTALLQKEASAGMTGMEYYKGFDKKVEKIKLDLLEFLIKARKEGKKVAGYGAAAKGNTLMNFCGIKEDLIRFVCDASPYKQGKFLPASHIPVVAEQRIRDEKPDYVIILPWNLKPEITTQLSYIREWGAQFVVAIPELIVD